MIKWGTVVVFFSCLLVSVTGAGQEPLFSGERDLKGKLPVWRDAREVVPDSVKKALSRCRPRTLACLAKVPGQDIAQAVASLDEWEKGFALAKAPMGRLGLALLGGNQKLSPLPSMGFVRYQLVRIRLAVRAGNHKDALARTRGLVNFFNGPLTDPAATPTMIITMVRCSNLTDLVATIHTAVSCEGGEDNQPLEYWRALALLRIPRLDGERIARGEVTALLKALPETARLLEADGGIPESRQDAEHALNALRLEVADTRRPPTGSHLARAMYLAIASAGLAQLEVMRLPMSQVPAAADALEADIRNHCPDSSRWQLGLALLGSVFSGKAPHEPGSFLQFGLDAVWNSARCGAFSNITLYWQRSAEMLTKTRGIRMLALAQVLGITLDGVGQLPDRLSKAGVGLPAEELQDAFSGTSFRAGTCDDSECPAGFKMISAGIDGAFDTADDVKITGECGK